LSIDRYRDGSGNLRDFVVAARELNPDRLIDNQRDWINRHSVYTHGNGFFASPANTVRGIANDPTQNGGYPEFEVSVVGPDGNVQSAGPAPLQQPRIYFGPVIASHPARYPAAVQVLAALLLLHRTARLFTDLRTSDVRTLATTFPMGPLSTPPLRSAVR